MSVAKRLNSPNTARAVRVVFVLILSSLTSAFVLSTVTFFFVRFSSMDYNVDGDVFTNVGPYGAQSGLRNGDRIAPETNFFDRLWIVGGVFVHPVGDQKAVTVLRNGVPHRVILSPDPGSPFITQSLQEKIQLIVRTLAFLAFVTVGTFLVLARPRPLTWAFYFFTLGPTQPQAPVISMLLNLPMPAGFILNLIRLTLLVMGAYGFAAFVLLFPGDRAAGWRRVVLRVVLAYAIVVFLSNFILWFFGGTPIMSSDLHAATAAAGAFAPLLVGEGALMVGPFPSFPLGDFVVWLAPLLIGVASLMGRYRAAQPADRQRLIWMIAGVLLANGTVTLQVIAILWFWSPGITPHILTVLRFGSVAAPFIIGYAVLKHRVIDVRFVVNRAVVYTVLIAILVIVFESFSWVIERLLQHTRTVEILQMVLAIGLAISLQHSFKHTEAIVNRWFFKPVHDAQEHLARVAAALASAETSAALERLLAVEPVRALKLTAGALFRRRAGGRFERTAGVGWSSEDNRYFASNDPLVLQLQDARGALSLTEAPFPESYLLNKTKCADQAVPIFSQGALTAIALYGPHANGAKIDPIERSTLANFAGAAGQAYDSLQARFESIRRLSELLEHVDTSGAYDELHYYLANQIIQTVPERTRTALIACAVIPQATAEDLTHATGDEENAERLQQLLSGSAVMRVAPDGTYALHPLIRHVLLMNAGGARQSILLCCAQAWQERQRHARAAELYREAGMHDAAAAAIDRAGVSHA